METRTGKGRAWMYKNRGGRLRDIEGQRKERAALQQEARNRRRNDAFTARRGIEDDEPQVVSRAAKHEEWKKKMQTLSKKEVTKRPPFVCSKITYNDAYLYQLPQSSKFNPPKGVLPVTVTQQQRTLRSHVKKQHKGCVDSVKEAINAFGAALRSKPVKNICSKNGDNIVKGDANNGNKIFQAVSLPKNPRSPPKNQSTDNLNRTFESSQMPEKVENKKDCTENPPRSPKNQNTDVMNRTFDSPEMPGKVENKKDCTEVLNRTFEGLTASEKPKDKPLLPCDPPFSCNEVMSQNSTPAGESVFHENEGEVESTGDTLDTLEKVQSCEGGQMGELNSAAHYRSLHSNAVSKLNDSSDYWAKQTTPELPENIIDDINVAIGYAKLLISQKLEQFVGLIAEHENVHNSNELKVLASDLEGFWNMVNNQVEDVIKKFDRLQKLKENNWQEQVEKPITKRHIRQNDTQKPKIPKPKGTTALRLFIQARKQATMTNDENASPDAQILEKSKPMSPAIMRVSSRAKLICSPSGEHKSIKESRTPLRLLQLESKENNPVGLDVLRSASKTPRREKLTCGSTPLRRSTRILHSQQAKV